MRYPDLPHHLRVPAARMNGAVRRVTRGGLRDLDRAGKLAHLAAISTDPLVLGDTLGGLLAPEHPEHAAPDAEGASLLRELGADEAHARRVAEWLLWSRQQRAFQGEGFRP